MGIPTKTTRRAPPHPHDYRQVVCAFFGGGRGRRTGNDQRLLRVRHRIYLHPLLVADRGHAGDAGQPSTRGSWASFRADMLANLVCPQRPLKRNGLEKVFTCARPPPTPADRQPRVGKTSASTPVPQKPPHGPSARPVTVHATTPGPPKKAESRVDPGSKVSDCSLAPCPPFWRQTVDHSEARPLSAPTVSSQQPSEKPKKNRPRNGPRIQSETTPDLAPGPPFWGQTVVHFPAPQRGPQNPTGKQDPTSPAAGGGPRPTHACGCSPEDGPRSQCVGGPPHQDLERRTSPPQPEAERINHLTHSDRTPRVLSENIFRQCLSASRSKQVRH